MTCQAGQQEHHLLGYPPALPAGDASQGLLVLAEGPFNHGAAILGSSQGHRLVVDQRGDQHRVLRPALLLGGAHHPWPRRATEAMRLSYGGALAPWARGGRPRPDVRAPLLDPAIVAALPHHLRAATQEPVAELGSPTTALQAQHALLAALPRPAQLGDGLHGPGLQGAGHGRRLGTAGPPTGPWHGWVDTQSPLTLRDGLRPTAAPQHRIEYLLDRARADGLLGDLPLFPSRGKDTVAPQVLSQSTQASTAGRPHAIFRHGALLPSKGYSSIVDPTTEYISGQKFALQLFQPQCLPRFVAQKTGSWPCTTAATTSACPMPAYASHSRSPTPPMARARPRCGGRVRPRWPRD